MKRAVQVHQSFTIRLSIQINLIPEKLPQKSVQLLLNGTIYRLVELILISRLLDYIYVKEKL